MNAITMVFGAALVSASTAIAPPPVVGQCVNPAGCATCPDGVQCAGIRICATGRLVRVGVRLQDTTGTGRGAVRVTGTFAPLPGGAGSESAGEPVLGSRRRAINPRPGFTTKVTLRPNQRGRALLRHLGSLRVQLVVEVTDRLGRTTTATQMIGLVAP
ncbi:MAG: hypothetical protein U0807_05585 [Candidatus Binatia bacterium]